jgi:FKBP-type peptidyl-prolyl cis-trans isomerase 2
MSRVRSSCVALVFVLFNTTTASADDGGGAMTVMGGKRVSIEYTLTLPDETQIDTNVGEEPLSYVQGGQEIPAALQRALSGLEVGGATQVVVPPEDGFGSMDPEAFHEVEKVSIPEEAREVGAVLGLKDPSGRERRIRVHEIKENTVVLDFNHLLAGKTLVFDVKVVKIEDSSQ